MKKTLLFTLVIINTFCSCDKNDNVTPQYNNPKNNTIKIGYDSNMLVNEIDTLFSGYYKETVSYGIDINNDSENDIVFEFRDRGGLGLNGSIYSIWVEALNNIEFLGEYKTDTSFLNKDISILEAAQEKTIMVDTICIFTCNRISANDSILEINEDAFKITAMDYGNTIDSLNIFSSEKVMLCENSNHIRIPWWDKPGGDTMIFTTLNHQNDCYNFPFNEEKYIGIKTIKNGSEKYGWIKIKITSLGDAIIYDQLEVIEVAIQE